MFKVLIVGCGNIAGGYEDGRSKHEPSLTHAAAISKRNDIEIIACIDPDIDLAREFAERWQVGSFYSDTDQLKPLKADVVCICSPTASHYENILTSFRFQPSVIFCEKPITDSYAKSQEIVEACRVKGIQLVANYSRHWDQVLAELVAEINEGMFGRIYNVIAHYNRGILNNGSHMLEIILRLFPELTIRDVRPTVNNSLANDIDCDVSLISKEGISVNLHCIDSTVYNIFELRFFTEKGEIMMRDGGQKWSIRSPVSNSLFNGFMCLGNEEYRNGGYASVMDAAWSDIVNLIQGAEENLNYMSRILQVQQLCEAIKGKA